MPASASDFSEPWKRADRALVIDAYEYNPIDWQKLSSDKRIVGFINKGSDGLSPPYSCSGNATETKLCKALWKRHAVARELFQTRRTVAKALGLKWGAYHLGRPGNPIDQANNFIDFADPAPDDLIALDIEENDPEKWMSLEDAETFVRHIHTRLGRLPVLYTNGSTALLHRREPRALRAAVAAAALVCALQAGDRPAFPEGLLADAIRSGSSPPAPIAMRAPAPTGCRARRSTSTSTSLR